MAVATHPKFGGRWCYAWFAGCSDKLESILNVRGEKRFLIGTSYYYFWPEPYSAIFEQLSQKSSNGIK